MYHNRSLIGYEGKKYLELNLGIRDFCFKRLVKEDLTEKLTFEHRLEKRKRDVQADIEDELSEQRKQIQDPQVLS